MNPRNTTFDAIAVEYTSPSDSDLNWPLQKIHTQNLEGNSKNYFSYLCGTDLKFLCFSVEKSCRSDLVDAMLSRYKYKKFGQGTFNYTRYYEKKCV